MARGVAEGKVEGKAEALAQVARNLKSSGMSGKLVSQYTGLSITKIKKL
jgi:predicted transposase YdaD